MHFLEVDGIGRKEGGRVSLQDIGFEQPQFRKLAVAGETGSGKSTLLKIIAGLAQPHEGQVRFRGVRVLGPEEKLMPGHQGIAYLSQGFELPPHYTVDNILNYENRLPEEEAETLYDVCRISHLLKRRTSQLSGGEKQRISLARLLITSPRLLLLDEPFSNLDAIHKGILRNVIHDIGERLEITCILVSHDPLDTLSWADEIIVLKEGRMVQRGRPEEVYRRPVNEYVAGLFGSYNLVASAQAGVFQAFPNVSLNGKSLFIRPEQLLLVPEGAGGIKGEVRQVRYFGNACELEVALSNAIIRVRTEACRHTVGDLVFLSLKEEKVWYI